MNALVFGMHRSGTSAMAQVLRAAGLYCGEDEDFVAPNRANPRGYIERHEILELNDALLASLGWTWDTPPPEPLAVPPNAIEMVLDGREIVERLLGADRPVMIKDPRISLLLPWWRQIMLDRFVSIVMVRSVDEVAWSMWIRDGFPLALGRALWGAYHRHLAATLEGLPVIVVDYPSLTQRPHEVVDRVLCELARLGVEVSTGNDHPADTIDPYLRRATQPSVVDDQLADDGLRHLAEAWSMGPVRVMDRFALTVPPPATWEIGILEIHRRYRQEQAAVVLMERRLHDLEGLRDEHAAIAPQAPAPKRGWRHIARGIGQPARRRLMRARLRAGLPNPLFDSAWYLATNPDVRAGRLGAWVHWRRRGWREGRDPDPLFDTDWYLAQNGDVRRSGMDPLAHYLSHGSDEGRDPGPLFDAQAYRDRYPDVTAAGIDPLLHYRRFGAAEGRVVAPRSDASPVES